MSQPVRYRTGLTVSARTFDWVVIYRDDHGGDGRWTVITARYGPLRGRRIVRGREAECENHYAGLAEEDPVGSSRSE